MTPKKSAEAATLMRILLTMFLGLWMAVGPGFRVAAAADAPLERPATAGPIIADTAVPTPPGQLIIQPFWSLGFVAGNFSPSWRRVSAGGNFRSFQMPIKITYGLFQDVEIYGQMAFIHNWANQVQDSEAPGRRSASFSGVSDLTLVLKYQLIEETTWRPTVTTFLNLDFPTGHHFRTNPSRLGIDVQGGGAYVFTGGFNLSKWLGPVYLYSNLWYSISSRELGASPHLLASPLVGPVLSRDVITWNMAAEWPLSVKWVALLEFYSSWEMNPLFHRPQLPPSILMGVLPGIEYVFNPRWSCELGVAIDLAGKNSLYGYTPIFTVIMTY
jgi:hypothetical protein